MRSPSNLKQPNSDVDYEHTQLAAQTVWISLQLYPLYATAMTAISSMPGQHWAGTTISVRNVREMATKAGDLFRSMTGSEQFLSNAVADAAATWSRHNLQFSRQLI